MDLHDPTVELVGKPLRDLVIKLLTDGFISFGVVPRGKTETHSEERMDERHVSPEEVRQCLRSGALRTDNCDGNGKWRYRAVRTEVSVIFTFDTDDEGNILVVITAIRSRK